LSNLVQEYYQSIKLGQAKLLTKGVVCWAPAYYIPKNLSTLELVYYDPTNELHNRYAVAKPLANLLFDHSPVHELHLENNEELLVIKAKRRKFVIFCEAPDYCGASSSRIAEPCCIGLPFWTFHDDDPLEFKRRVKALEYPWWIFMPEYKTFGMREGFLRIDRPQVIPIELVEPIPIAIHEDAMYLISEWFKYYSTGDIDPLFMEDRKALMSAL
jgi:hypothetical protein